MAQAATVDIDYLLSRFASTSWHTWQGMSTSTVDRFDGEVRWSTSRWAPAWRLTIKDSGVEILDIDADQIRSLWGNTAGRILTLIDSIRS